MLVHRLWASILPGLNTVEEEVGMVNERSSMAIESGSEIK